MCLWNLVFSQNQNYPGMCIRRKNSNEKRTGGGSQFSMIWRDMHISTFSVPPGTRVLKLSQSVRSHCLAGDSERPGTPVLSGSIYPVTMVPDNGRKLISLLPETRVPTLDPGTLFSKLAVRGQDLHMPGTWYRGTLVHCTRVPVFFFGVGNAIQVPGYPGSPE